MNENETTPTIGDADYVTPQSRKLDWETAIEIRDKWATGNHLQKDLAKEYGVSFTTINKVVHNKIWMPNLTKRELVTKSYDEDGPINKATKDYLEAVSSANAKKPAKVKKRGVKTILNMEKANEIRVKYATKEYTMRQLGAEYGVSCGAIGGIVHNRSWKADSVEKISEGRLTWRKVREIRKKSMWFYYTPETLSKEFSISRELTYRILANKSWVVDRKYWKTKTVAKKA